MDQSVAEVIDVLELRNTHLVKPGDLAEVVAAQDGVRFEALRIGRIQLELLAGINAITSEFVELFYLCHGHAVSPGDFPQGVTALDAVDGSWCRLEPQFLADENPVTVDAVELPQCLELNVAGQGNPGEGVSRTHDMDPLVAARRSQSELLPRSDVIAAQAVELSQEDKTDVEAQGDLRQRITFANLVHLWLALFVSRNNRGRCRPTHAQLLANADSVAAQTVQFPELGQRYPMGDGNSRKGISALDDVVIAGAGRCRCGRRGGWFRAQDEGVANSDSIIPEFAEALDRGGADAESQGNF